MTTPVYWLETSSDKPSPPVTFARPPARIRAKEKAAPRRIREKLKKTVAARKNVKLR
jgi:hypothetical protein